MTHKTDKLVLDRIVAAGRARGISRRSFMGHRNRRWSYRNRCQHALEHSSLGCHAKPGRHLRVAIHDANTSDVMDPGQYLSVFMIQLAHASRSYLTLVNPDGTLGADLADSWEASADAKVWTFALSQNARSTMGAR